MEQVFRKQFVKEEEEELMCLDYSLEHSAEFLKVRGEMSMSRYHN